MNCDLCNAEGAKPQTSALTGRLCNMCKDCSIEGLETVDDIVLAAVADPAKLAWRFDNVYNSVAKSGVEASEIEARIRIAMMDRGTRR